MRFGLVAIKILIELRDKVPHVMFRSIQEANDYADEHKELMEEYLKIGEYMLNVNKP